MAKMSTSSHVTASQKSNNSARSWGRRGAALAGGRCWAGSEPASSEKGAWGKLLLPRGPSRFCPGQAGSGYVAAVRGAPGSTRGPHPPRGRGRGGGEKASEGASVVVELNPAFPKLLNIAADDTGNRLRFQLELEFVQCLANPNYLNFLAQRGYFKDKAFVNYLKYLLYWKEPEYAKYLKYPQCLHMLELLQYEHFRKELVNAQCAKFIDEQQILHWQHYSRKRMRLQQALAEQQQQNNTSVK
ncbi:PREDICTED: mediator of RNA polymerase II transcription subunit 31 [Aptenodytes forsteri]|uniref:mediator of RNA polymerase II transcription subunit 31 n=1 Tax=Aptenodytes forsteri TaxID=9233 RepID=UPI000904E8CB|nr:PREDICTED: mediator of RNA polymerase II transcription subunit 31 [Aptenodytes forsteri]